MKTCFYCEKELYTITDEFLGDCVCPHCKTLNSFYGNEEEKKGLRDTQCSPQK